LPSEKLPHGKKLLLGTAQLSSPKLTPEPVPKPVPPLQPTKKTAPAALKLIDLIAKQVCTA